MKQALHRAGDIFAVVETILNLFALVRIVHDSTVRSAQERCFRLDDIPITAEAVIGSGVIETLAR